MSGPGHRSTFHVRVVAVDICFRRLDSLRTALLSTAVTAARIRRAASGSVVLKESRALSEVEEDVEEEANSSDEFDELGSTLC